MFETILVCVDGSEQSLHAAKAAEMLAKAENACVALVSVFDSSIYSPSYYGPWEVTGEIHSLDDIAPDTMDEVAECLPHLYERRGSVRNDTRAPTSRRKNSESGAGFGSRSSRA